MSADTVHGFPVAELEALRIGSNFWNSCLKYAVPYKRCILSEGSLRIVITDACKDEKSRFEHCSRDIQLKKRIGHATVMSFGNKHKFEEDGVAPSLDSSFKHTVFSQPASH